MNLVDAAWRRADLLAEVGRYADAERIVRTALGQAPDDVELLTMLGYLLRMQERYLDALGACDAALALSPDHGDGHAQRAWTLIAIHRGGEAIAAATEAVRLEPQLADRHLVLAQALSENNRVDDARTSAHHALRLAPRSVSALLTLAETERLGGNPDAAGAAVRQALAIDPANIRGRQLVALLDADRGVVRRSMRTLAEIAGDRPADPGVISMVWPIRRVVAAPRWWLPAAAAVVAAGGLVTAHLDHSAIAARGAAAVTCAVTVGFVLRVLLPAGLVPWRALGLSPPLVRRSLGIGLATIAAAVGLLGGYAAGGALALPILAVAAAPVLWACMMGEMVGQGLNDAGGRQFLHDWRREVRDVLGELRQWPAETRRDLSAAWHEAGTDERERNQRKTGLRQPLAVYQGRLRNNVLSAAFGLVTVLAAVAAVASWPSTGATVGLGLFALLALYIGIRVAAMKAVATPEGLVLSGPLWTAIVRWDRVAKVVGDDAENTVGLIPVRAPVLLLTDGRRFTVRQAAAYDVSARNGRRIHTWVDHVAAELEIIRLTYSPRPETSLG